MRAVKESKNNTMKIFFKTVIPNIPGLHPTPSLSDFDALPYPRVRWYPIFFSSK